MKKKILLFVTVAVLLSACCQKDSLAFNNADFYTADGKFNAEAAKDAIFRLMKYYNYPVTGKTRLQLWVSDYGTEHFTEVGLAAIMYANVHDNASVRHQVKSINDHFLGK